MGSMVHAGCTSKLSIRDLPRIEYRTNLITSPDQYDILTCEGSKNVSRSTPGIVGNNQAQWYYPAGFTHPQHQHHHQAKVGYIGGTYMNGYYAQPQPQPQYYTTTITCMVEDELWLGQVRRCLSTLSISLSCHQSQAIGFPQASFTKPNSTHPISGLNKLNLMRHTCIHNLVTLFDISVMASCAHDVLVAMRLGVVVEHLSSCY
ncbi:hypothetical protein YC2023_077577 [Brassica napus]